MKMLRFRKPAHGGQAIDWLSPHFLCDFNAYSGLTGPCALVWDRVRVVGALFRTLRDPIHSAIVDSVY